MKRLLLVLVVVAAVLVPTLAMAGTASACTQGLTPGWWKNKGADRWTGYAWGDDFDTVFGMPQGTSDMWAADGSLSLWEALTTGGGGFYAFNRQAVAGLLNSTMPGLDYEPTSWVIQRVWHAYGIIPFAPGWESEWEYQKGLLEKYNELGL